MFTRIGGFLAEDTEAPGSTRERDASGAACRPPPRRSGDGAARGLAVTSWAQVLDSVRRAVGEAREDLDRLDAVAGDGDLGQNMIAATSAAAALAATGSLDAKAPAAVLRSLGMALVRRVPSVSATLLARGLLQAAREAQDTQHCNGAAARPVVVAAALVSAGIEAIERAGHAGPGDRTMLDALLPLQAALHSAAEHGEPPAVAAAAAAKAASSGAESTRPMDAKVGRAGWVPDRAKGHVDAGAQAVAVIAAAVAEAIS